MSSALGNARGSIGVTDLDRDGWEDHVALLNNAVGLVLKNVPGSNRTLRLTPLTSLSKRHELPRTRLMGIAVGDYDGDGWLDLAITDASTGTHYRNNRGVLSPPAPSASFATSPRRPTTGPRSSSKAPSSPAPASASPKTLASPSASAPTPPSIASSSAGPAAAPSPTAPKSSPAPSTPTASSHSLPNASAASTSTKSASSPKPTSPPSSPRSYTSPHPPASPPPAAPPASTPPPL